MLLQQMTEVQQSGGVGGCLAAQINPDKVANRLAVIERVFDAFVRESEALLGNLHPEHSRQANRRPAAAAAARVERDQRLFEGRPRRHRFDLGQKPIPSRLLLLQAVFQFGKTRLH